MTFYQGAGTASETVDTLFFSPSQSIGQIFRGTDNKRLVSGSLLRPDVSSMDDASFEDRPLVSNAFTGHGNSYGGFYKFLAPQTIQNPSRWSELSFAFTVETLPDVHFTVIYQHIKRLFASGRDEVFEDGKESDFSRGLVDLIGSMGKAAIDCLSKLILSEELDATIVGEALRWIGLSGDQTTYADRVNLLQRCLFHSSTYVRDGAVLGLSFLEDPAVIPFLQLALKVEHVEALRQDMQQTIIALGTTNNDASPESH